MTDWQGLLVSVRDPAEVEAALEGGAAIIDVKDPSRGSLGAAAPETIVAVAQAVGGRVPWSCAAGELAEMQPAGIRARLAGIAAAVPTPAALKLGLAGMVGEAWQDAWQGVLAVVPPRTARVAVAYADWRSVAAPDPAEIIDVGAAAGCTLFLIDTADKTGPGLCGCCEAAELRGWIARARAAGMRVAVAGKLALEEIPAIRRFGPDVVAMRTAVCSNGRSGRIDATLVRRAVSILAPPGEPAP
jgi:uncharacterized protein (UPF0264 family)